MENQDKGWEIPYKIINKITNNASRYVIEQNIYKYLLMNVDHSLSTFSCWAKWTGGWFVYSGAGIKKSVFNHVAFISDDTMDYQLCSYSVALHMFSRCVIQVKTRWTSDSLRVQNIWKEKFISHVQFDFQASFVRPYLPASTWETVYCCFNLLLLKVAGTWF